LYYGVETFDLNGGDCDFLMKAEGNLLKSMLSIPNKCHSTLIYSALKINTTDETIKINQIKFLLRAIENNFVKMFIHELLELNTVTNIIGTVKSEYLNATLKTFPMLITNLNKALETLKSQPMDRFRYNKEVHEILEILSYENAKYRSFKLMRKLYFNKF
jgi:hypothetical protein